MWRLRWLMEVPMRDLAGNLGIGIGWRPELALLIDRHPGLGFVEIVAENFYPPSSVPAELTQLEPRGVQVIPHGIGLSLGGAEPVCPRRLAALARLATQVRAPLVSEHIAFVRSEGIEAGHLLPVARTRDSLDLLTEHIREAQSALPVPLALENIATLFEWPRPEMDEAMFLAEVLQRTGAMLLLDVSNLYANAHNHGWDPGAFLDRVPLGRIAYVHVAGGTLSGGVYRDSHAHPIQPPVLELLEELSARIALPGVLLE
jgi:uncharacterized protein (UPF0276 family)